MEIKSYDCTEITDLMCNLHPFSNINITWRLTCDSANLNIYDQVRIRYPVAALLDFGSYASLFFSYIFIFFYSVRLFTKTHPNEFNATFPPHKHL